MAKASKAASKASSKSAGAGSKGQSNAASKKGGTASKGAGSKGQSSDRKAASKGQGNKPPVSAFPNGGETATEDRENQENRTQEQNEQNAPQKAGASKGAPKSKYSAFDTKSKPKHGDFVEIINSAPVRGYYDEKAGVVYVNGVPHTPLQWRKLNPNEVTQTEQRQLDNQLRKSETFDQLAIPPARRGENIHEDNPDLHMSIRQETIKQKVSETNQPAKNTLYGAAAAADADRENENENS